MSDEQRISQRYRELPPEEPPRHLDEAILAAARRAAEARPAPLVVPSGRRRWYFPLAAAAIIVLAVAVTVHVQREQPDPEMSAGVLQEPPVREHARPVEPPPAPAPAKRAAPESKPEPPRSPQFVPDPKAEAPGPVQGPASAAARMDEQRQAEIAAQAVIEEQRARAEAQAAAAGARPQAAQRLESSARKASVLSSFAYQSPEQWLQGIDDLKRQGRHQEADKQLAEFRKRYPNYRIPEAILQKFEK